MNRWTLTDEVRNSNKSKIKNFLFKMENLTEDDLGILESNEYTLDLSDTNLNPYTLTELMKEFGYVENKDKYTTNGWQLDFWIYLNKPNCGYLSGSELLVIHGCGMTFRLELTVEECM